MNILGHAVGVCSWSLQVAGLADLAAALSELGLRHVQLALAPLIQLDDKRLHQELAHLRGGNIDITAGMIAFPGEDYATIDAIRRTGGFVPDAQWPLRRRLAREAARMAGGLGIRQVSTHVGFVPPPGADGHEAMLSRVRDVAGDFASEGVDLLLETGQERAAELRRFLDELAAPNVFVNFDPANMILYGAGDPIDAIRDLGPWVRHVHVKDATPSLRPGVDWGEEVPFGRGTVDPSTFLLALRAAGYAGPLMIERESGSQRRADVRTAIESLRRAGAAARA